MSELTNVTCLMRRNDLVAGHRATSRKAPEWYRTEPHRASSKGSPTLPAGRWVAGECLIDGSAALASAEPSNDAVSHLFNN